MALPRDRRRWGIALQFLGLFVAGVGALLGIGGSVAPWVLFSVFGVPLAAPGVLFAGVWSALAGGLALGMLRRSPVVLVLCGLVTLAAGALGGPAAPRTVTRQLLSLRLRLAPVNARLEQVNLAPIEPFGPAARSRDLAGPGPRWVVWGGALLVLGGIACGIGERWRRSCPQCRRVWDESRLAELLHCPGCGFKRTDHRQCARCFHIAQGSDRHCVHCGDVL